MAASSLSFSNAQILSSKLNHKSSYCMPSFRCVIQAGSRQKLWRHSALVMSQSSHRESSICCAQSSSVTENEPAASGLEVREEQRGFSGSVVSQLIPNSDQVNFLLTEICDTTSIAEFELKLNGFHLHVTRALSAGVEPPPPPPDYVSMSANTIAETPSLNGPVSPSSLAITKAGPLELTSSTLLERAADEGFAIIQSPKVGFFRRSRTIKGKRAPPACKEKQVVKEGQVICYIEQLGGEIPVESDVSGEITKILCKEGEPVGYGDAIIAILPSFPGIKKLS